MWESKYFYSGSFHIEKCLKWNILLSIYNVTGSICCDILIKLSLLENIFLKNYAVENSLK